MTLATPDTSLADGRAIRAFLTFVATPGIYSAVLPAVGGITPVRVERLAKAGDSVPSDRWMATSGTVRVNTADNVGTAGTTAVLSGTVDARLALADGSQGIDLSGTWGCSFANIG